jgi:hypothetical protein
MPVMFDHTIRINAYARLVLGFWFEMREDVHARGIVPDEEGFFGGMSPLNEVRCAS